MCVDRRWDAKGSYIQIFAGVSQRERERESKNSEVTYSRGRGSFSMTERPLQIVRFEKLRTGW